MTSHFAGEYMLCHRKIHFILIPAFWKTNTLIMQKKSNFPFKELTVRKPIRSLPDGPICHQHLPCFSGNEFCRADGLFVLAKTRPYEAKLCSHPSNQEMEQGHLHRVSA